jgi:predicted nicotinamide N-methyase
MTKPETITEALKIGNAQFLIDRVINIDDLIDEIDDRSFNEDERLPYWTELWPSGVALAEYIIANTESFTGKQVLELGSGLGLCGIAATKAGAEVLFSDYEPSSLGMVQLNFKRNFGHAPAVALIDWRQTPLARKFDIVIASDILYEKRWLEPVKRFISGTLLPRGFALIAEPGRSVARPFFESFAGDGWCDKIERKPVTVDRKRSVISIHRLARC